MNNEMPDEIELGLFYAPAPMSEHFYSVIDRETKMTPVTSAKYTRADKAVPVERIDVDAIQSIIDQYFDEVMKNKSFSGRTSRGATWARANDQLNSIRSYCEALGMEQPKPSAPVERIPYLSEAIKRLDETGEINRHNEEAIEEAARAYLALQGGD